MTFFKESIQNEWGKGGLLVFVKKLKTQARSLVNRLRGNEIFVKPQLKVSTIRLGSDYGGWVINPEILNKNSIVYSFGIGEDVSFDLAVIEKFGTTVHAFDPTPKSINWLKTQRIPNELLYYEYGIANHDGVLKFYPPENPNHVSHTILYRENTKSKAIEVQVYQLKTIMNTIGHKRIDLLKMDIEGAEYEVIDSILSSSIPIKQLLIEFHHRFPQVGLQKTKDAIYKLNQAGYRVFAVSSNQEEVSFIHT